jgi:hypothetical protein
MVDHVKPEPKFELISSDGLFSGLRATFDMAQGTMRALAAANPTLPRVGRLQRQCRRCLIANDGSATTTQIRAWCYPGRERRHWHHAEIRRALRQLGAVQLGRSSRGMGRAGIWALKID